MDKREKIEKYIKEELEALKEETTDALNVLNFELTEEEIKEKALKELYCDVISEGQDKIQSIITLSSTVTNKAVAFFIFHSMFLPSEVKKYLPFFNSVYKTHYTTIKKFLLENGFSSLEEWENYVKDFALDYQNGIVLKREQ